LSTRGVGEDKKAVQKEVAIVDAVEEEKNILKSLRPVVLTDGLLINIQETIGSKQMGSKSSRKQTS
jgi:hypothetical protein